MKKAKNHGGPLRCRLAARLRRRKPSIVDYAVCTIGAGVCRRCGTCKHYKPNKIRDDIVRAVDLLTEKIQEFAKIAARVPFPYHLPSIYELAEDEHEEEDSPMPKVNPYLNKTKED